MNVLRIAGYQSAHSILSASLQELARPLRDQNWLLAMEEDVTAQGETARSLFTSVECGVRQVAYVASSYLTAKVPELSLLDASFAVHDRALALKCLDSEVGKWLAQCVERRTGYKVLGWWDNGFRHISNRVRPIASAADCAGLRIRTLDSAVYRQSLAALGFTPQTIDVKDFRAAVASGLVDAQENPLANHALFSIGEYHPHLSLTAHFFGVLLLVCHRDWYEGLAAAERNLLDAASEHATLYQRTRAQEEDKTVLAKLHGQGLQVLDHAQLDLDSMRRAISGVRDQLVHSLPERYTQLYIQNESEAHVHGS